MVIDNFLKYQIDWLTSHNDIEFNKEEEDLIIQFLKDTAEMYQRENGCEDCISRESVRQLIYKNNDKYGYSDRFHEFTEECLQLPSVTPQQKTGRWTLTDVEGNRVWHCSCSECGKDPQDYIGGSENWWLIKNKLPKYCPYCGSHNGGGEE